MRLVRSTPLHHQAGILAFIILMNFGILGLILAGYLMGVDMGETARRLVACSVVAFAGCAYLGLRLRALPASLRTSQAVGIYSLGMLMSILIPILPFPYFYLERESLSVGPLLVAQSFFMTICIGIKMNATRHRF